MIQPLSWARNGSPDDSHGQSRAHHWRKADRPRGRRGAGQARCGRGPRLRTVARAGRGSGRGRPRSRAPQPSDVAKRGGRRRPEGPERELAADNIPVNAVAPGRILAPPAAAPDEARCAEQATPLGRWGGELEIAKAILALLDSDF